MVFNLEGNEVFQLVNESLARFGSMNHNELKAVLQACTSEK